METVYLGLQRVCNHLIETAGIGIEHYDGHRYALLSQHNTLIGEGYGKIAYTQTLHQLRNLDITRSITMCLDHSHQAMIHRQKTAEITDIVRHRIEVDLQSCGMAAALQLMAQGLKSRATITLEKDRAVLNILMRE